MTLPEFNQNHPTNVDLSTILEGYKHFDGLLSVAEYPEYFTALDAIDAYRDIVDGAISDDCDAEEPCAGGMLKAICGMITPEIADAIYERHMGHPPKRPFRSAKRFYVWVMRLPDVLMYEFEETYNSAEELADDKAPDVEEEYLQDFIFSVMAPVIRKFA